MNKLSRRFRQLFTKSTGRSRQRRLSRRLHAEPLEGRVLLAADLLHNDLNDADVNNDGFVAPIDALLVINAISDANAGVATEGGSDSPVYLDTNDDGQLSPIDVLITVNAMAEAEGPNGELVSYQPIALSTAFVSAPPFGGFSFVDNGSNDQIVIQGSASWLNAGFVANGQVLISDSGIFVDTGGTIGPDTRLHNNGLYTIASVTSSTLTVQGDLITVFPDNVLDQDTQGNPIKGTPFTSSTALFFRPIDSVSAGGNFLLGMLVEDLRTVTDTGATLPDASKGVFSGYVDVTYDSTDVTANGTDLSDLRFSNNYTGATSSPSSFATPGLIDEAGASAFGGQIGVPIGAREQLLWRTPFTAGNSPGSTTLFSESVETHPANDTLLFGINTAIPTSKILFQSVTIDIVTDVVARDDSATVDEGSSNNNINVLSNDDVFTPPSTNPTITQVNGASVSVNQSIALSNGSLTFLGSSKTGANFRYTPAAGNSNGTSFTYTISNGQSPAATDTATVTITINAVDDRPVITGPSSRSTNEDTAFTLGQPTPGFTITDPDSNNITVTLSLSPNNGTLSQTSFSGTPAQVTSTLNSITYTPLANSNAAVTLNISASDGVSQPGTKAVSITITPVNDPPVNVVPAAQSLFNTQTLAFTLGQFSVSDVDSSTLTVTLAITDQATSQPSSGKLSVGTTTGLTVTGNNSNSLSLSGAISALNTSLGSLVYDPLDTFVGIDRLTMTTSDGALSDTDTVPITVAPPQIPFAATDFYTANEGTGPFDLTPSPLDNDLKDSGATLSVTGISPMGAATSTRGSLVFDAGTFTYTPPTDSDFFGTDTFTYTIEQDAAHTPSSTGNTDSTGTVTIDIQPVNDGPINTVPGARSVNEDTTLSFTGANLISVQDIDAGTGNLTVILTASNGKINVTGGAGVSNNGSKSVSISGIVTQVNNTLGGLTYTPDLNFFGSDQLTINTNDNGNTGGGALTDIDTVNITISPINDPPTIVVPGKQSFFTDFDNPFTSTPNPFRISDVDAGTSNVQVDLTIGDGALTISSTTGVTVTQNPGGNNGIRITGSVTNINNALASGVTYRTSTDGDKTLSATVNDLGNFGGGGPKSASATVDVEVLDFVPIDIVGQVFIDHNGDNIKSSVEPGIEGVDIFLSGFDFQGNSVNLTTTTDAQGSYSFLQLRPNAEGQPYTITEQTPAFIRNAQGGGQASINVDVRGNVTLASGSLAFGAAGFVPEFADVWDVFDRDHVAPFNSGILVGMDSGSQDWSIFYGGGWNVQRFGNARLSLNQDGSSGVLTVFDSQLGQDRTANLSVNNGTLTYRGRGVDRVYRVIGGSELLGVVGATQNGGQTNAASGNATTDMAAFTAAVDSIFG